MVIVCSLESASSSSRAGPWGVEPVGILATPMGVGDLQVVARGMGSEGEEMSVSR